MDKGKAKKYLTIISATLGIIAIALLVAVALAKYVIKDEKNINVEFKDVRLSEEEIKMTPLDWTNGNVSVSINTNKNGEIYYKINENGEWKKYEETFEVEENCNVYTKIKYADGESPETVKEVTNIDKVKPTVKIVNPEDPITPDIQEYTILVGSTTAKISKKLIAKDEGGSELKTLSYAFSQSNTTEPTTYVDFKNEGTVTKDATGGKWYIWTNVLDNAGNRAEPKISSVYNVGYQVTYNANGGTGAPENQRKVHGTTLKLSTSVPTKTGYEFEGWATSSTATVAEIKAGGNYTANKATTLYAVWKKYNYINTKTSKYYMTLESAFNEANDGETIKALEYTIETTNATVASGKAVTLDLNGQTIIMSNTSVTNNGTLTIAGTSGTLTGSGASTITNNGTLVKNTAAEIANTSTATYSVIENNGTATISAGKVTSSYIGLNNKANGKLNITGGAISATQSGVLVSAGTVSMTTGTVTSTSGAGISATVGSVTVTGGTVTGKTYGIYTSGTSKPNVTLGTNDGKISITSPAITASTGTGVEVVSGAIFNFYDGVIKGATGKSINGTVTATATTGKIIKTTASNVETAVLGPSAVKVSAKLDNASGATYTSGTWTNHNVYVELTCDKVGNGIKQYQWSEDGGTTWKTESLTTASNIGTITFTANRNKEIIFRATDNNNLVPDTAKITIKIDKTVPTVKITKSNYKTFTWTASDSLSGIAGYIITTTDTTPTGFTLGSTAKGSKTVTSAGTYYVWIKDNAGNIGKASISAYTMKRSQGTGSTLTTRVDSTSESTGTEVTENTVVLGGTSVWAKATANTGYNTPVLKSETTTLTASGASITVNANTTISSSATVNNYTVKYDYETNGGTTATKTTATVAYGSSIDLTPTATKDGWTFIGWNTDSTATSKLNSLKMSTSDVTLYAIYSKTITGTFKYNADTTKDISVSKTIYNKETTATITAPATTAIVVPSGYTFRHWSTNNAANASKTIGAGENKTISANTTYYASYSKEVEATFYFSGSTTANTQSNVSSVAATQYLGYAGAVINSSITIPTAVTGSTGYRGTTYKGVSATAGSTTPATVDTGTTIYYAYYQVPITYYYYNGTAHTSASATRTATSNGTAYVSALSSEPTPSAYDGATYKGWSSSASGVNAVKPNETTVTTFYAYYQKAMTGTFNYYDGTKTALATVSATRSYISKSGNITTVNAGYTVPNAVKENRTIGGVAYTYRGVSTGTTANATLATPTTANTIFYASYSYKITVTFNGNGGTGTAPQNLVGTGYMNYEGTIVGAKVTMSSNTFTKTGYKFAGWATTSTATTVKYAAGTEYTLTSNMTLYAVWTKYNYLNITTSKYYMTLAEALNEAKDKETVQLLQYRVENTAATLASGKGVTFDLNGQTVVMSNVTLTNNGTLTITGANGILTGSGADTITNNGTATITAGTVSSTDSKVIYNASANAKLTVSGGSVKGLNGEAIYNYADGTVTVTNGTINATGRAIYNNAGGAVNISGGELVSTGSNTIVNGSNSTGTITISGGTIDNTATDNVGRPCLINYKGNVIIKDNANINSMYARTVLQYTGDGTIDIQGGTITNSSTTQNISCYAVGAESGTVKISGGTISSKVANAVRMNAATINISGGTISTSKGDAIYCNSASSKLNISGGTITTTTSAGISMGYGTLTITGGTVKGNSYGIWTSENKPTVTIGANDGKISVTTPSITSTNGVGLYIPSGVTCNFYDGKIVGTSGKSISGTVTSTATNCVVVKTTSGSTETAVLGPSAPVITAKLESSSGATYTSGTWTNKNVWTQLKSASIGAGIKNYKWSEDGGTTWKTTSLTTASNVGTITFTADINKEICFKAVDNNNVESAISKITIKKDSVAPTVSITRSDYKTFKWSASYTLSGIAGYIITTTDTTPTGFTLGSTASGSKEISSAGTYYVWVKDSAGNIGKKSITAYTMKRNQGTGSTLTTRVDSTSASTGTGVTANTVVLSGTTIWAKATANTGYNTPVLKNGTVTMTATGATATITANTTISSSATINTVTISYDFNGGNNMNAWKYRNGTRFTNKYDTSTGLTDVSVAGASGWEIVYIPIATTVGKKYTMSFDYQIPKAYTALSGYSGVGYQALNAVAENNNSSNQIAIGYLPTTAQTTSKNASLTFTATNTTTYFAFNFGMAADNVTTEIKLGNFKISEQFKYNEQLGTLPAPVSGGYTFNGWYDAKTGGNKITSTTTAPAANKTYYAQWTEAVARIGSAVDVMPGDRYFTSLQSAIDNAITAGDTIYMMKSETVNGTVGKTKEGQDIKINLNSFTIKSTSSTSSTLVNYGVLELSGGKVEGSYRGIHNDAKARLTVTSGPKGSVTINTTQEAIYNVGTATSETKPAVFLQNGTTCSSTSGITINNNSAGTIMINNSTIRNSTQDAVVNSSTGLIKFNDSGTIEQKSNIKSAIYNKSTGTIELLASTVKITSSGNGVYNGGSGTIKAEYGDITATGTAIRGFTGSVYIGVNNSTMIPIPNVTGGGNGVTVDSGGKIYFYDGTIKGKQGTSIVGTVAEVAGGYGIYKVVDNSNIETATLTTKRSLNIVTNGGTYNGTTGTTIVTGAQKSTVKVANPTKANYTVTYNYNGSGAANTTATATNTFKNWTLFGSGNYIAGVNSATGSFTRTAKTESGVNYLNFTKTISTAPTASQWAIEDFSTYTYTSGHTYIIKFKVRMNKIISGANVTFRHAAINNDYGTSPGYITKTISGVSSNWQEIYMTRTYTGTTVTLSGAQKTISPRFEFATSDLKGKTGTIDFDIKDLEIIDITDNKIIQAQDSTYIFGAGDGTLQASWTTSSVKLPTPTRTGYTFKGWYKEQACTSKAGDGGANYTPTSASVILYAKWAKNNYEQLKGTTHVAYYTTASEAMSGCTTGNTIKVLNNVTESSGFTIPSGKTIYLELNGKTISTKAAITNSGTLYINKTSTSGTISCTGGATAISNTGSYLEAKNATITSAGMGIDATKTAVLNGLTITTTGNAVKNQSNTMTIESCTLKSDISAVNGTSGVIIINNSKVTGDYGIFNYDATIRVHKGSTVTGTSKSGAISYNSGGTIEIGATSETLSSTAEVISGKQYGVFVQAGAVYLYNGKIQGETAASYGAISVRSACSIVETTSGNYKVKYLKSTASTTSINDSLLSLSSLSNGTKKIVGTLSFENFISNNTKGDYNSVLKEFYDKQMENAKLNTKESNEYEKIYFS